MNTQKHIKEKTLELLEAMIDHIKKDIFIVEGYEVSNDFVQEELNAQQIVNKLTGHSEVTIKYKLKQ